MAKFEFNLIFLIILLIAIQIKTGRFEEEKLPSQVAKGLKIFQKYLVPQAENMERLIKKIQALDNRLQKRLLIMLEEDPDDVKSRALTSFRKYEPLLEYGSSDFDWVIIEMELFMHRLKEDKGKIQKVYESVKKSYQILKSNKDKTTDKNEEQEEWYDYIKDYYDKKTKIVKKLFGTILEMEKKAEKAYAVLNSASKTLRKEEKLTLDEKISWKVNLADIERSMKDLKKLNLQSVHAETFRTSSLITTCSSIVADKSNLHRFFWTFFSIVIGALISFAFSFIREPIVENVGSFIVEKVVDVFIGSLAKGKFSWRSTRTNPILGSRIRNFGKKFGDNLRYQFNNLPDYMGSFTPLTEKELYCKDILD